MVKNKYFGIFYLVVFLIFPMAAMAKPQIPLLGKPKGISSYEKGKYQEALDQFLNEQIKHPDNSSLQFNIGDTHYRLGNYEEAQKAFSAVAASQDPELKWQAFYNLGNVAYQQGKLEEAITYYQKALELKSDDADAKYNLEFVREELKRRLNESIENPPEDSPEKKQEEDKQPENSEKQNSHSEKSKEEKAQPEAQPSPGQQANEKKSPSEQPPQGEAKQSEKNESSEQGQEPSASATISPQDAENILGNLQENRPEKVKKIAPSW